MNSLESLKIDLKGLKDEETSLEFTLDDTYLEALDGADVKKGSLHVSVSIRKATGFFEFNFHTDGEIVIPCDRCLDDMTLPVDTDNCLIVKLGSVYSEEDDVIVVPENEGILDMAWLIYEFVALVIPIRHVHAPGKCNPAMTQALEELSSDRSSDEESNQPIDPRWAKLKDLNISK
ncbi:Uncharacterized metal-binding protein YceD, DUF177 family [Prevotella sp. ne3005]|jgi:uncharacterized metal-binding protein YceD (DUF177 family)|uniref:YceD family protein n=1 Tax=Prevotella sp. ne3005 TaxID=1761887 RepID=UPI0008CE07E9|nr:DUF177 domain-containing protein [Prevotella sp. ne3005]SEM58233.1 Uncharacterized metal-binding protein YceD, DUF177 family [Prevotella sp. ne3005]